MHGENYGRRIMRFPVLSLSRLTGEFGLMRSSSARRRASTLSFPTRYEDDLLLLLSAVGYRSGDEGTRTLYLFSAIEALSQLSYVPTGKPYHRRTGGDCQKSVHPSGAFQFGGDRHCEAGFAEAVSLSLKGDGELRRDGSQ